MSTLPNSQTRTHRCGGAVLSGDLDGRTYIYCDNCRAFSYGDAGLPQGTDPAANQRAWDEGADRSPDVAEEPCWECGGRNLEYRSFVHGTDATAADRADDAEDYGEDIARDLLAAGDPPTALGGEEWERFERQFPDWAECPEVREGFELGFDTTMAEDLGRQCAADALEVAGDSPWDNLGRSLLPDEPQRGDRAALAEIVGIREETLEAFEDAYSDVIEEGRGEKFGARVREVRDYLDATQSALAEILQVSSNTVARWERGELTPSRSAEAGLILQLRRMMQHKWAKREHRMTEYEALARDALRGDGFSPETADEVARVCRNTADAIRDSQEDGEGQ